MPRLMISLLGRFRCEIDSVGAIGLEARKAQELLGYLALSNSQTHHRDALAGLLWGDRPDEQAKKGLRQTLWLLQSTLDRYANGSGREILLVDGEWIGFDPHANIWTDTGVLERTYAQYQSNSKATLVAEDAEYIRAATALYQGDLLEGWYLDWCVHERERFQFMCLSLLDKLLAFCETNGDYEGGVNCGMQILRYDNARESTHRRLMRLHYITGHRTRALHQYSACVSALREELGVEPAKSTQRLYRQICSDDMDEILQAVYTPLRTSAVAVPAPSNESLRALVHFRQALDTLRQQIDYLIATLQ